MICFWILHLRFFFFTIYHRIIKNCASAIHICQVAFLKSTIVKIRICTIRICKLDAIK
ncbi:hypothetical protein ECPA39_0511, partial [Escherichia coli PA39]